MYRKKYLITVITAAAICCAVSYPTAVMAAETSAYKRTDFAMDTVISETVYSDGEDITNSIGELLRDIETNLLSWTNEESEIYQVNAGSGESVRISPELCGYLKEILKLSKDSEGAMDPTLGKVIRLWDIDGENPRIPEETELKDLLEKVGYEKVSLSGNTLVMEPGCTLDLGAVGKGIGCDVIADFLEKQPDVDGALVNLGGSSVVTYGEKPDGSAWKIALTDPRNTEGDYLGAVSLEGESYLSTSGDYEKYFIEDGVRYHHILNPSDGYPVHNGITAVTVVCDRGLDADGLSTACFVLGIEKGSELLKEYGADGIFVDEENCVYLTEGMEDRFELLQDSYEVKILEND